MRAAARVSVVFTDIDDTLTTDGRLLAPAFAAMWALHDAGIAVVPVTGRPAGWCDHFARMWPIAGIVGENGAFYFRYDDDAKKLVSRFLLDAEERRTLQAQLADVGRTILTAVPGAALASDQAYRIHDLAIDFCEDVPPLAQADIDTIVRLFHEAGATAKVSSIHVNGWFGSYDKLGMIKRFAREVLDLDLDEPRDRARAVYAGDSPNDEPAFAFFEQSIGVANVRRFTDRLVHPPRFVTRAPGSRGFAELARHLLRTRR
ncbi:HAD-IIB family hydrolase [Myxococcota bacterium]|nr:HAD-IIB family hydrolase [Myxococcota bacterium]